LAAEATPSFLYLPELPGRGSRIELPLADAHYVGRVCRARVGEQVEATDGRGALAVLRLTRVRGEVVAEVVSITREEPRRQAWVLCGPPEGERADWLVEKLAELGILRFVPVDCDRAAWTRARGRRARWGRLAVAALRQSRRLHLMAVDEPVRLEQALAELPTQATRWLAEASGAAPRLEGSGPAGLAVGLVGPSGGLADGERELALREGFLPVCLSDARLRAETAALAWGVWWSWARG
jgi:16S rRNA (uracil1498-N3)-methyltransferase